MPSAVPGAKDMCSALDVGVVIEGAGEGEGDAGDIVPDDGGRDVGVATEFESLEKGEVDKEEGESSVAESFDGGPERFDFG